MSKVTDKERALLRVPHKSGTWIEIDGLRYMVLGYGKSGSLRYVVLADRHGNTHQRIVGGKW